MSMPCRRYLLRAGSYTTSPSIRTAAFNEVFTSSVSRLSPSKVNVWPENSTVSPTDITNS